MKYLLIPIDEISNRISYLEKEIIHNQSSILADYDSHEKQLLEKLKSKGEIVEIEDIKNSDLIKSASGSLVQSWAEIGKRLYDSSHLTATENYERGFRDCERAQKETVRGMEYKGYKLIKTIK